jgi:hypothetical protein
MTTAFAALPAMLPGPSPPTSIPHQPLYASQAQITPPSSAESPGNQSPVSPRATFGVPSHLQFQTRQLRPQKSPMYVPAVLRPTEKPVRQSPPKNKSIYGSPESAEEVEGSGRSGEGIVPGLTRVVTEEWNEETLGEVTGPPSRNHWKVRNFYFLLISLLPMSRPVFGNRSGRDRAQDREPRPRPAIKISYPTWWARVPNI